MFNVVTNRRKRSIWTPRTVAVSVGAHLLLLAAFVTAAESTPPETRERIVDLRLPDAARPKPAPKPVTPPPPAPDRPQPVKGRVVTERPPETVPTRILPPNPNQAPTVPTGGDGPEGDVEGTPDSTHTGPLTGNTDPQPAPGDGHPYTPEEVSVLPRLANEREAQRLLQRAYPPLLRDAGITGQATVIVVIDENGNVEPGSVRVQDATNPAFEEAARRVVEKFHFSPARLNGQKVSVVIALPIHWELQR
ncbi:TonB family protein [Longimicrobium sp.]|uniref:energy transducer TonB n=1 Tax=Longimicrobium sp. TaxID=2029185 RepID=UPI002C1FF970|nr:TonB family protein [Longimicrobium sp.]HSU14277.1 TonB family protein [Longimicrobium sp.]